MKITEIQNADDIFVSEITVISGIRPAGRTTDYTLYGRKNNGLLYIWEGKAEFTNGDKSTTVTSGQLLYIPKGCRYKMQYVGRSTTFVLINFELFTKEHQDIALSDKISVVIEDDGTKVVAGVMSRFELCGSAKNHSASLRRKELMYKLLGMIFNEKAMSDSSSQLLKGAILLQQTYLENIPISEFAEASNMSISSFRSLFTKQYGMSPIKYRNRLRIERASVLLSEGSCTVKEAAFASGFENIGYFCRYYKKITGKTPSEKRHTKNQ